MTRQMWDVRCGMRVAVVALCLYAAGGVFAYEHDVAVDSILKPDTNYARQGDPVYITGLFRNCGQDTEVGVAVKTMVWDRDNLLVYANTGIVDTLSLDPDTASYEFAAWNTTAGKAFGRFKIEIWSKLTGDQNDTNDVKSVDHYIVCNKNMAALDITSFAPRPGQLYTPKGKFQNQGWNDEHGVDVSFKILFGGGELYSNTKRIADIEPIEETEVEFDAWQTPWYLEGKSITGHLGTPGGDDNAVDDVYEEYCGRPPPAAEEKPIASEIPKHYYLGVLPGNAGNGAFHLEYGLPRPGRVELAVYDALGRSVVALAHGARPAGVYTVHWFGTDAEGQLVNPGVYFVRFQAGDFHAERKIVILR